MGVIYDRAYFERKLKAVKEGDLSSISWAANEVSSAFVNAKNALKLGRAEMADAYELHAAAADLKDLVLAVSRMIQKQTEAKK